MGYFEIYKNYEDMIEGKNRLSKWNNAFVATGKAFTLDFLFGIRSWLRNPDHPGTGDEFWHTGRYIRIGTSTNTNTGVVGPTSLKSVTFDEVW